MNFSPGFVILSSSAGSPGNVAFTDYETFSEVRKRVYVCRETSLHSMKCREILNVTIFSFMIFLYSFHLTALLHRFDYIRGSESNRLLFHPMVEGPKTTSVSQCYRRKTSKKSTK